LISAGGAVVSEITTPATVVAARKIMPSTSWRSVVLRSEKRPFSATSSTSKVHSSGMNCVACCSQKIP
jgi:hypothetical protein